MPFSPEMVSRQRERGRLQRQLALDFVGRYTEEHGWAPTVREVADALEVSISTAHQHLRNLQGEGRLVIGPGPRMIRIAAGGSIRIS